MKPREKLIDELNQIEATHGRLSGVGDSISLSLSESLSLSVSLSDSLCPTLASPIEQMLRMNKTTKPGKTLSSLLSEIISR